MRLTIILGLKHIFEEGLGFHLKNCLIKTPNIINHKVEKFVLSSPGNCCVWKKLGVFITKSNPLLSRLLILQHLLLVKNLVVLILKMLLQSNERGRRAIVKLSVDSFYASFQLTFFSKNIPKHLRIKNNRFIFHLSFQKSHSTCCPLNNNNLDEKSKLPKNEKN